MKVIKKIFNSIFNETTFTIIVVVNIMILSTYSAFMLTVLKTVMEPSIKGYSLFIIVYVIANSSGRYVIIYALILLIKKIVKICKKKFERNRL